MSNPDVKDPVTIQLGCDPFVNITLTETPTGTVFIEVASADPTQPIGDFDGVFFNLASDSVLDDLVFFPEANTGSIFSPVTGIQANANSVNTLSNGAQVKDSYDVGIQFGTVDNSTQGEVAQANFTLFSEGGLLTLDDLDLDSFATVVDSDGGMGKVLTVNDGPDDDPVLVDVDVLFEDFDDIHDPADSAAIVSDGGWDVRNDALFTNGSNDGTLQLAAVNSDGPASIMFDASVNNLDNFEASGRYADELRLEVRLDNGQWQTLDTFVVNGDKSALVGSNTGNEITETSSTLNYDVADADGSVEFRFVSDISANNEQISIDNLKVTVSDEQGGPVDADPVAVKSEAMVEDFDTLHNLTDSANVVSDGHWEAAHDAAVTDGHNDGTLQFAPVDTDGPVCLSFDAQVADASRFEATGQYADSLELQVRLDDGSWQTLDTFVVNDAGTALVGSETGNEITEQLSTLSYEGGVLDGATDSAEFRFISDISAADERILIDNVTVEATEMVAPDPDGAVKVDFDTLSSGDVVGDQFAGVTISAQRDGDAAGSENDAMIFDSNNVTGGDSDLSYADQGNILIISEDNDSSDADDNAGGGVITFDFDDPSEVVSINMLDIEETGGTVDLLDDNGDLIRTVEIPTTGDGGAQELAINTAGVSTMNINFVGSGAVDDLCYVPPTPEEECDDCYDVHYAGDMPLLPWVADDQLVHDMPEDDPFADAMI